MVPSPVLQVSREVGSAWKGMWSGAREREENSKTPATSPKQI